MEYVVPMFFGLVGGRLEKAYSRGSVTATSLMMSPQEMLFELQKTPLTAILPYLGGYVAVQYWGGPGVTDWMKYLYAMGGGAVASFGGRMIGY